MAKMQILFDGFADLAADIDRAGADLHEAVDEALTKTSQYIQEQLASAASPYAAKGLKGYATGEMYGQILNDQIVSWHGSIAEINAGFNLSNGGWHSIFIMYGTPRMAKDQKVYNAIKGSKTKQEIAKIQQEVMKKYVKLGGE